MKQMWELACLRWQFQPYPPPKARHLPASPAPTKTIPPPVKKFLSRQSLANTRFGRKPRHFGPPSWPSAATQSRFFPYNARVNRACNIPLHWDEEPDLRPPAGACTSRSAPQPHAEHPLPNSV